MGQTQYSVQGSITVRRLRTGATLTLGFTQSGALQQFINVDLGDVTPDWSEEANQPTITPKATASTGGVVTITVGGNQGWFYNGALLVFDGSMGTTSDGWIIDTTGKFAYNSETCALRIIDNLASKTNYASDTLEFTCTCQYEGNEYVMSASLTVSILESGTSGYVGYLYADNKILSEDTDNTDIHAQLFNGVSNASGFFTKWYKGSRSGSLFAEALADGTTATINVTRDDVNGGDNNDNDTAAGGTLFVCEFYLDKDDDSPVATAGINIADEADEYSLLFSYVSENKSLDEGKPVTVQADIYSLSDQSVITTTKCKDIEWALSVLTADLEIKRTVDTQTIELTIDDSEDGNDVNVIGDAKFSLLL